MKSVSLYIDNSTQPQKLAGDLKNHDLKHGDKLTVNTVLDEELTFLIIIVALISIYQNKKIDYANKVLGDLFASKNSKEMQDEIAKEYGIEVNVETKKSSENETWHQYSKEKLSKAFGTDEPNYDLSMVKEPNPDYKK
jgi:hypothetical protein